MNKENRGCLILTLVIISIYIFSFFVHDLPDNLNWIKTIYKWGKVLLILVFLLGFLYSLIISLKNGVENISTKIDSISYKREVKSWLKDCKTDFREYLYENGVYRGNLPNKICKECDEPFYAWETYFHTCIRCYKGHNNVVKGIPHWEIKRFQKNLKFYSNKKYFIVHESWLNFDPKVINYDNFEDRFYLELKRVHRKMMGFVAEKNKKNNQEFNEGKTPFKNRLESISELLISSTGDEKFNYYKLLKEIDPKSFSPYTKPFKRNYDNFDDDFDDY